MKENLQSKREELTHRTFTMMFKILIIFGIPAIAGFFAGKYIDARFGIRPYGSVGVLAVTFVFSWIIIIKMYLGLSRDFKELRELEEKEENKVTENAINDY